MHFVDAKSILSPQNGMNIYRGCSHGCIYCDSRSSCYGMKHDFEDIEVKQNAPELLEQALKRKRRRCMIGTGSMCDPYLHCEKELCLTQRCLNIIDKYGFGASILTKSDLILRDLELLRSINEKTRCVVQMTVTTYDEKLCRVLEPKVCTTARRFEVLRQMNSCGIPTVVWLSPILPFINDNAENIYSIISSCADAGVKAILCFGMGVTLREGDREYFYAQLDKHIAGMREIYQKTYGCSYNCESPNSAELMSLLQSECESFGIICEQSSIFEYIFRFEDKLSKRQLTLFD